MTASLARPARVSLVLVALVLSLLLPAPQAHAHSELRASSPEQGSTVQELTEVRLEFGTAILDIGAELAIEDAAGERHELAPDFSEQNTLTAPVDAELAVGDATLAWRVIGEDGHPVEGVVSFTYAPDSGSSPTASPDSAPAAPEPSPTAAAPSASATSSSDPSPSAVVLDSPVVAEPEPATPGWLWPVIGVAALVTAATALVLVLRRRGVDEAP
ncbi:copper resistance protein CopC [Demequina sp. NBRC 110053]|uniref:copper resistance CopC family protein n=1 Tax=Demequina sp. NBRC 110053 TaxID=1570342 RepID=UPI0009FE2021|nr:copper resistance protein CopC [Demequina sp. NBRC 110053]